MSLDAVKDWSTNATLNTTLGPSLTLDGTVMKPSDVDNAFRELMAQVAVQFGKINFKGASIASAATTNLANATGNFIDITGTTAITGLGTVAAGQLFFLRFTGALSFTHNATSLILPGAANITTANGDIACMLSLGAGNWLCAGYTYASGLSATGPTFTQTYSDNGNTGGPDFVQMRESTSPAAGDVLGRHWFRGRDSAGNIQDYGLIAVIIDDPTSGSEDSHFEFYNVTAGGLALKLNLSATGINTVPIGQTTPAAGAFTSLSATGAVALSPASANVVLSPTGTGVVTINPATAGSINNVTLGASTPLTVTGTTVTATAQLVISGAGAGQIVFPASQNASANANTFDDYEEGSFTPVTKGTGTVGTGTYNVQDGRYTKIGNCVTFTIMIDQTNHSGTTSMFVDGLPFATNGSMQPPAVAFAFVSLTYSGQPCAKLLSPPTNTAITLYDPTSGGGALLAMDTACTLWLSGLYYA